MSHFSQGPGQALPARATRAFVDYYRCSAAVAPFRLKQAQAPHSGFFRFGQAVCYGKLSEGTPAGRTTSCLFDAGSTVEISSGEVLLCFDPDEVVENFRHERYLTTSEGERLLRKLYYYLRPGLPLPVRIALQRLVASRRSKTFPTWPVDCTVEQIFESMMALAIEAGSESEIPFIWFWPDGHDAAMALTHDVEEKDGVAHCESLMDIDDSFGLKAAFQIIPETRYDGVDKLIARVRERGHEANLHDLDHDGRLYENREQFRRRVARINAYARQYGIDGFRAGAMHRNHDWFDMLEFQYDMSVPTASHLEPQRGGCCTVMPYFNGKLLELPLTTVQDHGLFYILGERSINLWKRQMEIISGHHGLISFIIHPDYVIRPEVGRLYRELLEHISQLRQQRNIWLAVPGEINRWWRNRNQMQLVRDGDSWQVQGPGSERAQVAYATIVDGALTYRIAGRTFHNLTEEKADVTRP